MTPSKRLFDLVLALFLATLLAPLLLILLGWMALREGRPLFYISERMKTPDQPFRLIKLRTMRMTEAKQNAGVSGGDKTDRISRFGHFLRRSRLDELPQLWNILRGDMSFIGPRPPLRQYVKSYPELYDNVLKNRPGITGLATLTLHAREERLLSACHTAAETEAVYTRRCVPQKARLDLIYQRNQSLCFDLWLLMRTGAKLLRRSG
jgi:lipopolysaccharide/colanic/teichoic acid biosynthesis glycosyltransferase